MDVEVPSFREFEHDGWEDPSVVVKYHNCLSSVTNQAIEPLLEAAHVRHGSHVLDVATGAGYVAGAAANRGAHVVGIDFSGQQVRMARERYGDVRFEEADAEALPFESRTFDAVVNAFGMCHVPNPDVALSEACRVLKHGGRLAFTVWDVPERAVALGAVYAAIKAHGSLEVGLPTGPNFFLFSNPNHSSKALVQAGFASPNCRQVPQVWRVSDPDEIFAVVMEGTVRAAATLRRQSAAARESIRAAMRDTFAAYKRDGHCEVPAPAVLATAIKP